MSSKRAKRRRACGHKIKFPTAEAAQHRIWLIIRAGKGRGGTLVPYRCRGCGHFHFGHRPGG